MRELKPCPFCGEEPQVEKCSSMFGELYRVYCNNPKCKNREYTGLYKTKLEAISVWNIFSLRQEGEFFITPYIPPICKVKRNTYNEWSNLNKKKKIRRMR